MRLLIVTATTNMHRARPCLRSWLLQAQEPPIITVILNGCAKPRDDEMSIDDYPIAWIHRKEHLGTVPAFRLGTDAALEMLARQPTGNALAPYIACLHDDLEIHERGWDQKVMRHFEHHPKCGLLGFGGAIGLGAADIYETPYNPMQLARQGFRSNLVDAEAHGARSLLPEPVACLDGFSQVGREEFWGGSVAPNMDGRRDGDRQPAEVKPWTYLEREGFIHHFYDGALGAMAKRHGWEAWYLPVRGRHLGGQTAVGDSLYQEWAKTREPGGDKGFWEFSHKKGYHLFRDVLPLRA